MRTVTRSAVLLSVGFAVLLGMAGGAVAQDSTEDRLRALEEKLQQQDAEIQRLRSELAEQTVSDSLSSELDQYLGKVEDGAWWQEPNTLRAYYDKGLRFQTTDKKFALKVGGRVMIDHYWADYDSDLSDYLSVESDDRRQVEVRRARMYMSGTIWGNTFYKLQVDFAGDGDVTFKDVYLGVKGIPVIGNFRVGNQKEPFSLEEVTSSKYITFLERGLPNVFAPGRNMGIMIYNAVLDKRLFWFLGVFNNGDAQDQITQGNAITARLAGLPIYEDKGHTLVHVGVAYSYRHRAATAAGSFSARPEAHMGQKLLSLSPSISESNVDSQSLFGLEFAVVYGQFSLQAEYIQLSNESDSLDDPVQSGFYVFASFFVTGEHRKYKNGAFSRVSPLENFDGEGGMGAIELAIRYSMLDYEDGVYYESVSDGMPEGQLSTLTFGVNWYLNPNMRIMVNYIIADLEGVDGVSILQIRWQIDF